MRNLLGKYNDSDGDYLAKKIIKRNFLVESRQETYRGIVHIQICYWKISWYREDNENKECPRNANRITQQTHPPITHVEWARFKHHIRVTVVYPTAKYRDNITQIQCHSRDRENSIGSNWAGKIQ